MSQNVGGIDRILRILVGLAAIAFALFSGHELAVWGWIGILPLATGVFAWCPAYLPFGLTTRKTRHAS
ncbi:MAG: DUF2892 domain-containing protein [Rhodospirillales bacterium]|nr:MAG: DUF2892 domain-containing protein [Rhodospirillales bacterium]